MAWIKESKTVPIIDNALGYISTWDSTEHNWNALTTSYYGGAPWVKDTKPVSSWVIEDFDYSIPNTYSVDFDGTDDYVDTGFQPDFIHTNATMSYWCKLANFSGTQILGCHNSKRFYLGFTGTNIYLGTANTNKSSTDLSAYISADTWMHLCLVMEDGAATFYLDGVSRDTNSYTQASATNPDTNFFIGATSSASTSFYMEGNIDEVAVWNTALDADAVKVVYNGGKPTDLTVNLGTYDEYTDNLKAYWRMGDGTLDDFPLIADQVNPTLGQLLVGVKMGIP